MPGCHGRRHGELDSLDSRRLPTVAKPALDDPVARSTSFATVRGNSMYKSLLLFALVAFAPLSITHAAQIVNNGECFDLPQGNTADGTPIILFHCHGTPNEQWTLSGGQITGSGGSCVDVQGSAPTEGAAVILVTCNGRSSQRWN